MRKFYLNAKELHTSRETKAVREWAIKSYDELLPVIKQVREARYACHDVVLREMDDWKLDKILDYAAKLKGVAEGWLGIDEPEAAEIKAAYSRA